MPGATCPKCGEATFYAVQRPRIEGALKCNRCGARGWVGHPTPMRGSGSKCLICDQRLVRNTGAAPSGAEIQFCYGCGAVAIS